MDASILNQLRDARNRTLKIMKECPEASLERIPAGFENHILWNLGHIFTISEKLLFLDFDLPHHLPADFPGMFGNGTRPSRTEFGNVSPDRIFNLLAGQPERIEKIDKDVSKSRLSKPFQSSTGIIYDTVEKRMQFSIYHEGVHTGYIMAMRRAAVLRESL